MATRSAHNKNNAAVKRILQEARELANDSSTDYHAAPLEDNIFDWHCTIRGPKDTEFEGGLYHCRILLPAEYPFRPPSLMLLTPNGRFELNTKICISFTSYHEELWQPAWGIRTAIVGLQGFFPQSGEAAMGVGALRMPVPERRRLATLSREWRCPHCQQRNIDILPNPPVLEATTESSPAPEPTPASPSQVPQETVSHSFTHNLAVDEAAESEAQVARHPAPAHIPIPAILSAAAAIPQPAANADATPAVPRPRNTLHIYEQPITPAYDEPPVYGRAFEAYPTTASSNGIPIWLDGAILIMGVFAVGIMLHLFVF